jgi:hypothetical protein
MRAAIKALILISLWPAICDGALVRVDFQGVITETLGTFRQDLGLGHAVFGYFVFDPSVEEVNRSFVGQQYAAGRYFELASESGFYVRTNYATIGIKKTFFEDRFFVMTTAPMLLPTQSYSGGGNGMVDDIRQLFEDDYDFAAMEAAIQDSLRLGFPPEDLTDTNEQSPFVASLELSSANLVGFGGLSSAVPQLSDHVNADGEFWVSQLRVRFKLTQFAVVPEMKSAWLFAMGSFCLAKLWRH